MKMRFLISLPTYNERNNIEKLVDQILAVAPDVNPLIIDDNSPDGTGEVADQLAKKYPGKVMVIHRQGKLGLGSAILAGFKYAIDNGYDFVINMDCDFSHDPKDLPKLINAANHADLVIGSRHLPGASIVGWTPMRKLLHFGAQKYTNLILGSYVSDHTNSYKAYRVSMLKNLPLEESLKTSRGFVWHTLLINIIHKKGYKIAEVPITFVYRTVGQSKMSMKEMLSGLYAMIKIRFFNPLC